MDHACEEVSITTSHMHPSPLGVPFDWLWQLPQLTIGYRPRWIMSWHSPRHPQRGKYIWKYPVLRTTSHASREPVNTLVLFLNELINFKSLKLQCFSFLSHILRYLNCHASVGITSLSDISFHPPPHPDKIVVRHTHSPCHVASLWCRHHQCHYSLY